MSRHRAIRNMDLDDELDDGYDEELEETRVMTDEQKDQMADGVEDVLEMLGDANISVKEIEDALWYYYFDVNQAADYLLEQYSAAASKKQAAAKKSNKAAPAPPAKAAPKVSKPPPKHHDVEDEDIVEYLEGDDEDDAAEQQMRFDMSAMNFGTLSSGSGKATPKKTNTSGLKSAARTVAGSSAPGSPIAGSGYSTPTTGGSGGKNQGLKARERIDVVTEFRKRTAEKESLNLVVIGHVDAGKSTLMGHLLYLQGEVSEKTIRKHEREAQKLGKASFAFAWVLDETGEERSRGITMDVGVTKFETEHIRFTLLDAPGHRDFIPNMISGTAQADVAILVVDSTTGEFESGFDANGQTKEHALLARSLGVRQLVVAVNKLDVVQWSEARFQEIVDKLETFLVKDASFKKSDLTFIPCSGFTGENLVKRTPIDAKDSQVGQLLSWYKGPTMIERIDKLEAPPRAVEKPFRMSVTDFFKGTGGVAIAGRLEAGHVQVGEQVLVMPGSELGIVKQMEINDEPVRWAAAGDSVLMTVTGIDLLNVSSGTVLCSREFPIPVTTKVLAKIVVFDLKIPITVGFPIMLHHQSHAEPGMISKLVATIDKVNGEILKKNPRHLGKNSTATVEIQLAGKAIPMETFQESKELGRIMLRKGGETIAAGIVTEILNFGA